MALITGFEQDDDAQWVALLNCGHRQHVRHRPPWETRTWVTTPGGREERLGTELVCSLCAMPRLPEGLHEYKRTKEFDATTVPEGLTRSHRVKAGVWGEIVVTEGHVRYVIETDPPQSFPLNVTTRGVVAPTQPHHVVVQTGGRFFVRFLRALAPPTDP